MTTFVPDTLDLTETNLTASFHVEGNSVAEVLSVAQTVLYNASYFNEGLEDRGYWQIESITAVENSLSAKVLVATVKAVFVPNCSGSI